MGIFAIFVDGNRVINRSILSEMVLARGFLSEQKWVYFVELNFGRLIAAFFFIPNINKTPLLFKIKLNNLVNSMLIPEYYKILLFYKRLAKVPIDFRRGKG